MVRFALGILIGLVVAYFCGVVTVIVAMNTSPDLVFLRAYSLQEGDQARRALEDQLNVEFPASASEFHRADLGGKATWMRFNIARNDLPRMFSGFMTCQFPLRDDFLPNFEYDRLLTPQQQQETLAWWQPADDSIRSGAGGECTGSDYRIFRVFADRTDPETWEVFLEVVAS